MWLIGLVILSTFFAFKGANAKLAEWQGPGMFHIYATPALWCFFPLFGALSIPWPLTVWLLRRMGRNDEADEIAENSSAKVGFNSYSVMKWLSLGMAGPIFFATLLAIPIHLSIGPHEARLGHYARLSDEVFDLQTATKAIVVYKVTDRKNIPQPTKDLLLEFKDGRHLDANAVGDGGTSADPRALDLLLANTPVSPAIH